MRFLIPFCLVFSVSLTAQQDITFDPDSVLVTDRQTVPVLLVGSFHFDYPGLDDHKTADADKIDVLTEPRASEVAELNDYIARFKPTKIIVERHPGSSVNEEYRRYLTGDFALERDEIHQVAFRLGKRFSLDSLLPGDANNLSRDLYYHPDSAHTRPLLDELYVDEDPDADTSLYAAYAALYNADDSLLAHHTLLEFFRYANSPRRILRGHGHYLEFTADPDPDALAIGWYARNLRIYRNIQQATEPSDRILVLFGSGHLGILRQQFQSSPRYELVEFDSL